MKSINPKDESERYKPATEKLNRLKEIFKWKMISNKRYGRER
jgi:hypothetical protein